MVRARLRGINTVRKRLADGSVRIYYYHRATSQPLRGKPGSAEFVQDLASAEKSMRDRLSGSFNGLVRDYTLSAEFGGLRDSTQKQYRRMLTSAEAKFGDMPIAAIEDPRVRKDFTDWRGLVAKQSGAREADNRLGVISAMLSWAREEGHVSANHLSGFRRIYRNDRSEIIWLPEHVAAFMRAAPVELQRAMILALHTGQRQGDLLRLTWGNYDGATISLRQGKTGRKVEVPATKALKRELDRWPRTEAVILTTTTSHSWTGKNFRRQWLAACRRAELPAELHFHDLRGTAVTLFAQAGATVPQIASITGHSLKEVNSILEKYLARTKALASEAIVLFENAKSTRFANRLQTGVQPKRGVGGKWLRLHSFAAS
jgi:integrase